MLMCEYASSMCDDSNNLIYGTRGHLVHTRLATIIPRTRFPICGGEGDIKGGALYECYLESF